jgi:aryl-alcohol dehydrogenase-like predicted oxidoreductase
MKSHRIVGTDLKVSSLCLGGGSFGTTLRGAALHRLYDQFREAGGNFFDTAHCYSFWVKGGHGASETALGECVRRRGDRTRVVIATKGGHPAVPPLYPRPDRYLAPEVIAGDVRDSLERLRMDHIDLYYLHRDDPRVPVAEIIDTLNAEITRGRIRYLGASNWTTARIDEANKHAKKHRKKGFVASQPLWNLAQCNPLPDPTMRHLSEDDARWHARHHLPVVPYSSTACGYFASGGKKAKQTFDNPVSHARLRRAEQLSRELKVTRNQIALGWLMSQPFPVIPILGTTDPAHLKDALGSASLQLIAKQAQWLWSGDCGK